MKKIIVLMCIGFISLSSYAKMTKEQRKLAVMDVSKDTVNSEIKSIIKSFKELVDTKEIFPGKVMMASGQIKLFALHPFIEGESGYKRSWLQSLFTVSKSMIAIQNNIETATVQGEKKDLAKNQQIFKQLVNQFIKIAKNPKKVDKRRRKELEKRFRPIKRKLIRQYKARMEKIAAVQRAKERAEKKKKRKKSNN